MQLQLKHRSASAHPAAYVSLLKFSDVNRFVFRLKLTASIKSAILQDTPLTFPLLLCVCGVKRSLFNLNPDVHYENEMID